MLKGKHVVLAVSGGIAAYKMANLTSMLVKQHCDVTVIMTENATHFINPITFETLSGHKCLVDTFDRNFQHSVEHVALAKQADALLVAPATANVIAKLSYGLADDMLTTTALACTCPKFVAPAMNTRMYGNPVVQDNLKRLQNYGMTVIAPESGRLACGDTGAGKLVPEQTLMDYLLRELAFEKDLQGTRVLVTAGATQEAVDPVRFLTNHSTGKMGYAIAKAAMLRGAEVTLISGSASVKEPPFVQVVRVTSAQEMFEAVRACAEQQDMIVKAAAVADYRPKTAAKQKIKKSDGDMALELERTPDILAYLGEQKKPHQILCGFSMETEHLIENSRKKLLKKQADLIAANSLCQEDAGFGTDTNRITLIGANEVKELPLMTKDEAAHALLDELLVLRGTKQTGGCN